MESFIPAPTRLVNLANPFSSLKKNAEVLFYTLLPLQGPGNRVPQTGAAAVAGIGPARANAVTKHSGALTGREYDNSSANGFFILTAES